MYQNLSQKKLWDFFLIYFKKYYPFNITIDNYGTFQEDTMNGYDMMNTSNNETNYTVINNTTCQPITSQEELLITKVIFLFTSLL